MGAACPAPRRMRWNHPDALNLSVHVPLGLRQNSKLEPEMSRPYHRSQMAATQQKWGTLVLGYRFTPHPEVPRSAEHSQLE